MFDIGFWELALIGVVALLVVGPDRLPALARTLGIWVGRIRRYVSTVRDDIEREIQADELRNMLSKPDDLNPLKDIIEETTSTIKDANKEIADVEKQADDMMSAAAESKPASGAAAALADNSGADAPSPDSAATTVAQAVSARREAQAQVNTQADTQADQSAETPDGTAEDAKSDEQRST